MLAHHRHGGPVYSVVLLLRRQASLVAVSGTLRRRLADGRVHHDIGYEVVGLWGPPTDELQHGPLCKRSLAALTDVAAQALPEVFTRIDERLRYFFFSSRRRHTRCGRDWSSDVCSSDLVAINAPVAPAVTTISVSGLT